MSRVFHGTIRQTGTSIAERTSTVVAFPDPPRVIWRLSDGKPGHDNQSQGLIDALGRRCRIDVYDIPVPGGIRAWTHWLSGRFPDDRLLPDPWLIVGAGHSTHLPMLVARRARGGRAVVLMKPDLPNSLFDLCIIPEHDRPLPADNILVTRGGLNRIRPVTNARPDQGMFLIGGPSRHYLWNHEEIACQVEAVLQHSPIYRWVLTTSRRTPVGFAEWLRRKFWRDRDRLHVVPFGRTSDTWLGDQFEQAANVWVTEDSVSMIYEALTAQVRIGLLSVPPRRYSRVVRGVEGLVDECQVTRFDDWYSGHTLELPGEKFNYAESCAEWIHRQWGPGV